MKKILILGSNGMLGSVLCNYLLKKGYNIIGIDRIVIKNEKENYKFYQLDLLDFIEVEKIIFQETPDIIINTAAIVNLNLCQENYELAKLLHVDLNKKILDLNRKIPFKFIYISTDSVFDGTKSNYTEEDEVMPLNNYAKTKFLGEEEVKKMKDYIVIRTNIYGYSNEQNSLLKWVYNELNNDKKIFGYENVIFNPVSVYQLTDAISILIQKDFKGTLNIVSGKPISKFEFLEIIERYLKKKNLVQKSLLEDENSNIKRPKNTVLSTKKMEDIIGKKYKIEDGIIQVLEGVKSENRK
ncbi:dTDP-4-dehydrorhamnose reductase family protein [Fusobacterium canifelinum]|uniref:SDR family oxidoreductase n=1 Tax=Fusobacterium canifelinum TaxID=285729 RepID=A0A3P1V0I1_9FUSO|nr:SDR family oxidoreductase [Fusobacterium canifelinum]RRD27106.1 SDR family oxidoreductase [Fusobacterium canifelinum]